MSVKCELFQINELRIIGCHLRGVPARTLFTGLTSSRLSMINTTVDCNPDDCQVNSLLLNPPRHDLLWTFEGNSCRTPSSNASNKTEVCTRPAVTHTSGLTCRLSWAVAECVCSESSASLPALNVTIVIVGDCEHLKVTSKRASPSALYLFRIGRCDVISMPTTIRTLKVYHSNVVLHRMAMEGNHISMIALSHTKVHKVALNTFVNTTIDELIVGNSSLANWHPEAAHRSTIYHAAFADSKLGVVKSLLRSSSRVSITNSVLLSTNGLSTIRSLHLSNNTVLCCCEGTGSQCRTDAVMRQKCAHHFPSYLTCNTPNHISSAGSLLAFVACFVSVVISVA